MARFAGNGKSYRVVASEKIAADLRRFYKQARAEGRAKEFMVAVRKIGLKLSQCPFDVGEPLYGLPALRVQVRLAIVGPLLVDFAVHQDRPLVFIKGVRLLAKP